MTVRRSRARSYLLLSRVSNLPTVWTNVLAAYVVAGASRESLPIAAIGASLFYVAGMFLNDAFDTDFDRRARADRPIPNGDVSRAEVFAIGVGLLLAGESLLALLPYRAPAMMWGVALAVAILFYDFRHKGRAYGPVVMGACRALVYCVAAAGALGHVSGAVFTAAATMWAYVIALTWVAKAAKLGYAVPWMLAGICLVDALMLLWVGRPELALAAALGFPLTIALQRIVPGT